MTIAEASKWSGKEDTEDLVWVKWGDFKEALNASDKIERFCNETSGIPASLGGLKTGFIETETAVVDSITNAFLNKEELTENDAYILCTPLIQTYLFHIGRDYRIDNSLIDVLINKDIIHKDLAEGKHEHEYGMIIDIMRKMINNPTKSIKDEIGDAYATIMTGLCGLGRWAEAAKFYQPAHRALTKYYGEVPDYLLILKDWIKAEGVKISDPVYAKTGKNSKNGFTTDDARAFVKAALNEYMDYRERKKIEKKSMEELMREKHFEAVKR